MGTMMMCKYVCESNTPNSGKYICCADCVYDDECEFGCYDNPRVCGCCIKNAPEDTQDDKEEKHV